MNLSMSQFATQADYWKAQTELLERQRDEAVALLRRVAYAPWGPSDASASDVLEVITEAARAFLAHLDGGK